MISNRLSQTPPVVKNLIIINVILYLALFVFESVFQIDLNRYLGLFFPTSEHFKPFQIVTHMFMHGGITHIFFNMFALWMFGKALETVWGPKRFLLYYLVTGLGAAAIHTLTIYFQVLHYQSNFSGYEFQQILSLIENIPTVGASGAVFGILLAFGMLFPNTQLMLLFPPIPIRAKYFVMIYGGVELYLGITQPGSSIAHFAHIGGMIFGYFLIRFWRKSTNNFY